VLEVCLDTATQVLFTGLEKNVFVTNEPPPPTTTTTTTEGGGGGGGEEEFRIRLAGLLPGLTRWSELALNGLPNELVDVSFFFISFFF
jgi:peroxin-3